MKIFILEDSERRIKWFNKEIKKVYPDAEVDTFKSVKSAIRYLEKENPDILFLDHDLDGRAFVNSNEPNTGFQLAKYIAESKKKYDKIIIHSMNIFGSNKIHKVLKEAKSSETIYKIPFPSLVVKKILEEDESYLMEFGLDDMRAKMYL